MTMNTDDLRLVPSKTQKGIAVFESSKKKNSLVS